LYARALGHNLSEVEALFDSNAEAESLLERVVLLEKCIDLEANGATNPDIISSLLKELDVIPLPENHPYYQVVHYVRAKALFYIKKYERSKKELKKAISLAQKYSAHFSHLNIEGCAYNILSNLTYWSEKDVPSALDYIDHAIESFRLDGERLGTYYMSLANKASFLENAGLFVDSGKIAEQLLPDRQKIERPLTKAAFCELIAKHRKRNKQYEQALDFANEGLQVASDSGQFDRAFLLLVTIGTIYKAMRKPVQAENTFRKALLFSPKVKNKALPIEAYNELGYLFMEQGQLEQAAKAFDNAMAVEADDDRRKCKTMLGVGDLLLKQGKHLGASKPYHQALELAIKTRMKKREFDATLGLVRSYKHTDKEKYYIYLERLEQVATEQKEEEDHA
jgi:tetratricopeptide (TPR) repeat protein